MWRIQATVKGLGGQRRDLFHQVDWIGWHAEKGITARAQLYTALTSGCRAVVESSGFCTPPHLRGLTARSSHEPWLCGQKATDNDLERQLRRLTSEYWMAAGRRKDPAVEQLGQALNTGCGGSSR